MQACVVAGAAVLSPSDTSAQHPVTDGHHIEWKGSELRPLVVPTRVPAIASKTRESCTDVLKALQNARAQLCSATHRERTRARQDMRRLLDDFRQKECPLPQKVRGICTPQAPDDAEVRNALQILSAYECSARVLQRSVSLLSIREPCSALALLEQFSEKNGKHYRIEDPTLRAAIEQMTFRAGTHQWAHSIAQICTQCQCIPQYDSVDPSVIDLLPRQQHAVYVEERGYGIALHDLQMRGNESYTFMLDPVYCLLNVHGGRITSVERCSTTVQLPIRPFDSKHFSDVNRRVAYAPVVRINGQRRVCLEAMVVTHAQSIRVPIGQEAQAAQVSIAAEESQNGSVEILTRLRICSADATDANSLQYVGLRANAYIMLRLEDENGTTLPADIVSSDSLHVSPGNYVSTINELEVTKGHDPAFAVVTVPTTTLRLPLSFTVEDPTGR